MNVGIIGAGAIGLLLASYLSEEHAVTLYVRQEQDEERPIIR
ncbi:MAG: 2-dehydropantoate 2-reductase N-terminal domain-containing protein, partial [Exiguobacterium acetylicum]